ncbi:hypothetical protein BC936DRAFT_146252, partial [Jimgerdemannia flammicorona]
LVYKIYGSLRIYHSIAVEKAAKPAHPNAAACGPARAASTPPVMQPAAVPLMVSFLARYWWNGQDDVSAVGGEGSDNDDATKVKCLPAHRFYDAFRPRKYRADDGKVLGHAVRTRAHVFEGRLDLLARGLLHGGLQVQTWIRVLEGTHDEAKGRTETEA